MLDEFQSWVEAIKSRLEGEGVRVEIKKRTAPAAVINAVFEAESYVASITCWDTGALDVDVLNLPDGTCVLAQRFDFQTAGEMLLALEELHQQLAADTFNRH